MVTHAGLLERDRSDEMGGVFEVCADGLEDVIKEIVVIDVHEPVPPGDPVLIGAPKEYLPVPSSIGKIDFDLSDDPRQLS